MSRALAIVAAVLAVAGCATGASEASQEDAQVARVGDGDTIDLAHGSRVRLVQIDAPELGERECFGAEAAEELRELLPPGASVHLEADPRLDDADRFDRLLRYVHRDGLNVNVELVRRGAASVWFVGGERGRYADELLDAAEEAQDEGRGLWSACPGTELDPERGVQTRSR
ncbi:MAG: thermonuclease family protein [Gaiellaceae bacterium]